MKNNFLSITKTNFERDFPKFIYFKRIFFRTRKLIRFEMYLLDTLFNFLTQSVSR